MAAVIIGIGNPLRSDDGIGPAVIAELTLQAIPNCRLIATDMTGLDLIKYFRPDERIIIVDAAEMGAKPGTIRVFLAEDLERVQLVTAISTHGMGLLETIRLVREIGYDSQIWFVGVQIQTYSYHDGLSEKLKLAIPQVTEIIKNLLK